MTTRLSWTQRIEQLSSEKKFGSRTCKIYVKQEEKDACQCGRLRKAHSFELINKAVLEERTDLTKAWNEFRDTKNIPMSVYGILPRNNAKFIRCDNRQAVGTLYDLILEDRENVEPSLLISAYGGARYFTLSERLEKDFITGIIDLATRADAWILTAGVNNGVANLIGEGISQYRLLREHRKAVTCIGLAQWGSITEEARMELKRASPNHPEALKTIKQTELNASIDTEVLEPNHTHYILLDNGQLSGYLGDGQRAQFVDAATKSGECYGVTIIVEGGVFTLGVIQADLDANRPVVIIQNSGRISDVLANLIQLTRGHDRTKSRNPTDVEIEENLVDFFPMLKQDKDNRSTLVRQIDGIFKHPGRHLLHVYRLDSEKNISETIFQAIFQAYQKTPDEKKRAHLLDLSVAWDFLEGAKQLLEINKTKEKDGRTKDKQLLGYLFRKALELNRPSFVDYILRCGYDARHVCHVLNNRTPNSTDRDRYDETISMTKPNDASMCHSFILHLYNHVKNNPYEYRNKRCVDLFFGNNTEDLTRIEILDAALQKWLGSYIHPIYESHSKIFTSTSRTAGFDKPIPRKFSTNQVSPEDYAVTIHEGQTSLDEVALTNGKLLTSTSSTSNRVYLRQEMLRDLFLWSVFMNLPEMTKVLLTHMTERICASLIAAKIFKSYASNTGLIDLRDQLQKQASDFEMYSAQCVEQCYDYNEVMSCELLLRETPSFGRVTCMQIAISGENAKFLETPCFAHVLDQIWNDKLPILVSSHTTRFKLFFALITFGLIPAIMFSDKPKQKAIETEQRSRQNKSAEMSDKGINYYFREDQDTWWEKMKIFHRAPVVKMCYHFLSYVFFLLVFSYMMLYHFDSPNVMNNRYHWTEIYTIITVTTMFFEEFRQSVDDCSKKMLEEWNTRSYLVVTQLLNPFHALPFLLFYLGTFLHYAFGNQSSVLTAARIIMAFDLELWYLRSFRFVTALKFLGPKLFMLRNMLRDLAAFVYMIFIAIAAYGVVSRSLFMYKMVPFTGQGIFENIFYSPYWFIHGVYNDTATLDNIIHDSNSTLTGEAIATHVLLAFHMLFINILLLNLIIAVFTRTIQEVQENTEFYWRFQRYSFVREYFHMPCFAYPPLIVFPHVWIGVCILWRQLFPAQHKTKFAESRSVNTTVFKMIPKDPEAPNREWNKFENAATSNFARSAIWMGKNKESQASSNVSKTKIDEISHENLQMQITEITLTLRKLTETLNQVNGIGRNTT